MSAREMMAGDGLQPVTTSFKIWIAVFGATLGAFMYNMSAALLGGIELTLVEDQH